MTLAPYLPRHRRSRAAHGPYSACDVLFCVLAVLTLLLTAFVLGGLAAHPFAG